MPQDSTVFVERIERITEPTTVYDVTVKDSHNFFADGILVHNCPPPVQAAFLRVIAEKIVGDTPLPADTLVVTACNPSGMPIDERQNSARHRAFGIALSGRDLVSSIGSAPDGSMPEPGYALLDTTLEEAA